MAGPQQPSFIAALAIRFAINAAALWIAAAIVDGFEIDGWQSLIAMAVIFGFVNTFVTPVVQLLGCPITMLTLGLFALVINAAMLAFAVWIGDAFDLHVELDGFFAAVFAALIISVTSWFLSIFVGRPVRRILR